MCSLEVGLMRSIPHKLSAERSFSNKIATKLWTTSRQRYQEKNPKIDGRIKAFQLLDAAKIAHAEERSRTLISPKSDRWRVSCFVSFPLKQVHDSVFIGNEPKTGAINI